MRQKFIDDLEWAFSQLEVGKDNSVQPCAVPGCEPWPTCCQIDLLSSNQQNNSNNTDDDMYNDDGGNGSQNNDEDDAKKDDKKLRNMINSWQRPRWGQL